MSGDGSSNSGSRTSRRRFGPRPTPLTPTESRTIIDGRTSSNVDRDTAAVRWLVWSIGGIAALVIAAFLIAWLARESKRREEFAAISGITNSADPEPDPDQRHYVELWVVTKRPAEELAALADLKFYRAA
jgi:hypothetical protein